MPKFVIERELPGAGKLSPEDLEKATCAEIMVRDEISRILTPKLTDNVVQMADHKRNGTDDGVQS